MCRLKNKFFLISLGVLAIIQQVSNSCRCLKKCPSVPSTRQVQATCYFENRKLPNCCEPVEGTTVKYECGHFYNFEKTPEPATCQNGSWSHPRPKCVPICGRKFADVQLLIANGNTTQIHEYPWHVAIYKEKKFLCSGILINERVVLTIATCMKSEDTEVSKESYTVAPGKYYRQHNDSREKDVDFSTLDHVFIPEVFRGYMSNYAGDIAVLVTTKTFVLSRKVHPICIDWDQNYHKELYTSQDGYITGWGYVNANESLADELQELQVPIIDTAKCHSELDLDFLQYLTYDKFCAGHPNLNGKTVSRGDAGGGLVIKHNDSYYLTGILSLCPIEVDSVLCDGESYSLYTNVLSYVDFIKDKIKNVTISEEEF